MIRGCAAEVAISVSGVTFCLGKRNEKNTIKGSTLYTEGFVSDCERPVIFGLLPLKDIRTGCLSDLANTLRSEVQFERVSTNRPLESACGAVTEFYVVNLTKGVFC